MSLDFVTRHWIGGAEGAGDALPLTPQMSTADAILDAIAGRRPFVDPDVLILHFICSPLNPRLNSHPAPFLPCDI